MRWAAVGLLACLLLRLTAGQEGANPGPGEGWADPEEGEEWEDEPWTPESDIDTRSDVYRVVMAVRADVERANYQTFYEWTPMQYREFTATGHWWHPDGRYLMVRARINYFDVAHIRLFVPAGTQSACLEAYRPFGELIGRHTDAKAPLEVMEAMDGHYGCAHYRSNFGGGASEAGGEDETATEL